MQITVTTAANLVGTSRRTLRRRMGESMDGTVTLQAIRPQIAIEADDALILAADHGDHGAQTDIAVLLLEADQPDAAVFWLQRAAVRHPDAMHQLSRCYLDGLGVAKDVHLAMMWLHKAASAGHVIALAQAEAILNKGTPRGLA